MLNYYLLAPVSDSSVGNVRFCPWTALLKCGLRSRKVPAAWLAASISPFLLDPGAHFACGPLSNHNAWICSIRTTNGTWLYACYCSSRQDYTKLILT